MASEKDIRQLLQRHGYELVKVKRCKTHDNLHFQADDIKVTAMLKVHIENLPLEDAEKLMGSNSYLGVTMKWRPKEHGKAQ